MIQKTKLITNRRVRFLFAVVLASLETYCNNQSQHKGLYSVAHLMFHLTGFIVETKTS